MQFFDDDVEIRLKEVCLEIEKRYEIDTPQLAAGRNSLQH